jgi:hypothetical protein
MKINHRNEGDDMKIGFATHDQVFVSAANRLGEVREFFGIWSQDDLDAKIREARAFVGADGMYIALMGRDRLNDYVGSPVWSDAEMIDHIAIHVS